MKFPNQYSKYTLWVVITITVWVIITYALSNYQNMFVNTQKIMQKFMRFSLITNRHTLHHMKHFRETSDTIRIECEYIMFVWHVGCIWWLHSCNVPHCGVMRVQPTDSVATHVFKKVALYCTIFQKLYNSCDVTRWVLNVCLEIVQFFKKIVQMNECFWKWFAKLYI